MVPSDEKNGPTSMLCSSAARTSSGTAKHVQSFADADPDGARTESTNAAMTEARAMSAKADGSLLVLAPRARGAPKARP